MRLEHLLSGVLATCLYNTKMKVRMLVYSVLGITPKYYNYCFQHIGRDAVIGALLAMADFCQAIFDVLTM